MTQYLLSVFSEEGQEPPSSEAMEEIYRDVDVLNDKMKAEGAWVFAGGLHEPDTATVIRMVGDEVMTTDGPYAEAKEQIGGFWVIEAPDLDVALDWAAQATKACQGPVELRPFQEDAEV